MASSCEATVVRQVRIGNVSRSMTVTTYAFNVISAQYCCYLCKRVKIAGKQIISINEEVWF